MKTFRHMSGCTSWKTVLVIAASALSGSVLASTGSWQGNPGWAADEPSQQAPSPRTRHAYSDRGVAAPFVPGSNNLAIDVGQVFLMGDLATNYSDAIGFQLHYTYGVSDLFGFDMSAGYSEHSDGKFSMGTLLGGLRTNLAWYDKVVPYLVFGLGFYRPSYEQTTGTGLNATTTAFAPVLFGVHAGPGVDLQMTRQLFFGAAITFHDVFGSARLASNTQLPVGGTFTSFLLHAGFSF